MELPGAVSEPSDKRYASSGEACHKKYLPMFEEITRILEEEHRSVSLLLAKRHQDLQSNISSCFARSTTIAEQDCSELAVSKANKGFVSPVPITTQPRFSYLTSSTKQKQASSTQSHRDPNELSDLALSTKRELSSSTQPQWRPSYEPSAVVPVSTKKKSDPASSLLSRIVSSHRFEAFFDLLICLNCLIMAFELQHEGMTYGSKGFGIKGYWDIPWVHDFLNINDWFFGILFSVELLANLLVKQFAFFLHPELPYEEINGALFPRGSSRTRSVSRTESSIHERTKCFCEFFNRLDWWNIVDFIVVLLWVLYKVTSAGLPFDPMVLRLARLGKLLRALKLMKTVSRFDSLYLLTTTIQGSMAALAWSVTLLFVVEAMLSFILCQQLKAFCENESFPPADRRQIWLYFGTYSRSLFTMFELTLGNWVPVGRALMDMVSEWLVLFTLLHKFLIGFAVVSVINGVFMQTTFKVAATDDQIMIRQREKAAAVHKQKMSKLFQRGDVDGNGFLTRATFSNLVGEPALRKWMASMELSIFKEEDVDAVFSLLAHQNDKVELDDLVRETSRLKGLARTIDIELRFQEVKDILTSLDRTSTA